MERRSTIFVVLATFFTCGIYGLYWMWRSTSELGEVSGRELRPGVDLLLTIVTLGIWAIWVGYRNSELVHAEIAARGEVHIDRSLPILGIGLLTWFTGLSWLVVIVLLQEDYNRLADASLSDGFIPRAPSIDVPDSAGLFASPL